MHAQQTDWNQGLQTRPASLNRESQLLFSGVRSYVMGNATNFSQVELSALCCSFSVGA